MLFYNGKIISKKEVHIDPADRGFMLGDGLFETILMNHGKPIALNDHWSRFNKSAKILQIPLTLSYATLNETLAELTNLNHLSQAYAVIRMTLTRGPSNRGISLPKTTQPTMMITIQPYQPKSQPLSVTISTIKRNECSPLSNIKSLAYLDNILAKHEALQAGYDDAILLNTNNHVCCGSTANLFIVSGDTILTPKLSDGALPGITRQKVLALAKAYNMAHYEQTLTLDNLLTADEAFFTNSLIGLQAISCINKQYFFKKMNITQRLYQSYRDSLK